MKKILLAAFLMQLVFVSYATQNSIGVATVISQEQPVITGLFEIR